MLLHLLFCCFRYRLLVCLVSLLCSALVFFSGSVVSHHICRAFCRLISLSDAFLLCLVHKFQSSFFTLFDLSLFVCGGGWVGVFFFLSFPFLFFSFLFFSLQAVSPLDVKFLWFFWRIEGFSGLETWQFRAQWCPLNRNFFPFWSFFLLGIGLAIGSHQSIEKGLYILLFLYLQNFKWGFIKNLVLLDWWSPRDLSISVWHIAHHVELLSAGSISI